MKYGLFFVLLLIAQNAFALYGAKVETSSEGFVVSLFLNDKENPSHGFFCNGVLISPTKILTAGHCISEMGINVYEMSQALIYYPQRLKVNVGGKMVLAKTVTYAPSYFEGTGHDAEDLALIELRSPVTHVKPIQIAIKYSLSRGKEIALIARGTKVNARLLQVRSFSTTTVLYINKNAGACSGDSGGAIVINEKGRQLLAGILMYDGDSTCYKKTGYGHFPKVRF